MTTIVCRSTRLASEITAISGSLKTLAYPFGGNPDKNVSPVNWLSECLRNNAVSVVMYEPQFFVDPAQFRSISPNTRFVVLSSPGDEQDTQTALICGACAVIDKPLTAQDVRGVLSLVSQ